MKAWLRRYWLLWVPPVVLLLCVLLYRPLLMLEQAAAEHIFYCPLYELTGLYCPGCGGTRSLTALLHGKLLLALHENPAVPALVLLGVLFYIERAAAVFGKRLRLFPRRKAFWIAVCAVHLTWAILRNFLPVLKPCT